MRDYKDKHWDSRFEEFKRQKERKRLGLDKPVEQPKQSEVSFSQTKKKKEVESAEARVYVNKGPSRFLRTHSNSSHSSNSIKSTHSPMTGKIEIVTEPEIKEEFDASKIEVEKDMIRIPSLKKMLPYIFMILAIIIAALLITGKI